ncbi:hypothetical protein GYMLUDRAFT_245868 [Collybiopsis luxurians FD-317 M1]|uniref:Uncharacterized protein n=1 Tax=Collybiopsis luxurians FD-317 M1 TaxID=944289 RepID=A0A0D0CSU3_9AGAR|nr:hypothetical protein GYMLUDRAFT_245868 [Collybiopsis luxurians FD-317 M1]
MPQQTRYLVSIDLGRVERLVYDQSFEAILNDLGLDARGVAATENWEVDVTLLRASIRRLRGIALIHRLVGQVVGQNDRLYKSSGALKTMADVLQNMKDLKWRNLLEEWKSKIQAMIKLAQLKQLNTRTLNRFQAVLETLLAAEKEAEGMIAEIEKVIAEHDIKGEALRKEAAEQRAARENGNGKQREESPLSEDEDDDPDLDEGEEGEDGDLPKTPAEKKHRDKRRALVQRLREARIQYHRENDAYAAAEAVRRDILKITEREAKAGMAQSSLDIIGGKSGMTKTDLLIPVPYLEQGGIRSTGMV